MIADGILIIFPTDSILRPSSLSYVLIESVPTSSTNLGKAASTPALLTDSLVTKF